jgi:hypothetical protein
MGFIRHERLKELEHRYVRVAATTSIGDVRAELADDVRWVVVEHPARGGVTWSIVGAHTLNESRYDDARDIPIQLFPEILRPAMTLERTAQGIGEARWRAWRTRDRVVVITESGRFAGLVGDPDGALTRGDDAVPAESRFLRAKVEAAGADPALRVSSFAPDRQHRVTVSIGPREAGLLVAETEVPAESTSTAQMLKVTVVAPWITSEGQMFLPPEGASSDCVLDLGVPPPGLQRVTVLVMSATGLVQTATLIGETTDQPVDVPIALLIDPSLWPQHGDPQPTLVADTDRVVAAVPVDEGFDVSATADLEQGAQPLYEDLDIALQELWYNRSALDDLEAVDVLRTLARAGAELRDDLFDRLPAAARDRFSGSDPIQLVVRDTTVDIPLEQFYDFPPPHPTDSVLCAGAREALTTGTCPHCGETGTRDVICPMGFWGLRRVIERRVVDPDPSGPQPLRLTSSTTTDRPLLAVLDNALVARSERVEEPWVEVLYGSLREADVGLSLADNWTEWSQAVSGDRPPPLLIAMPHVDQAGRASSLEIGSERLERVDLSEQYVCFPPHTDDRPGPLVLLLGCETAVAPVAHRTMTSRFLTKGAAIVLGTRVPVIAEAAPVVGAAIIRALVAQSDDDELVFGEAMLAARRQLVAEGQLVALALVALGDGGWRVPVRRAA